MSKPAKTKAELDEERLREIEARIKEAIELLKSGVDRGAADERVARAREERDRHKGNRSRQVFHRHQGGKDAVPTSVHTKSALDLAEALRLRIRLGDFAADVQDSLARLAEEQNEILERVLKRARY
jgi:hypothetical protein